MATSLKEDSLEDISVDKMSLRDRENWSIANMDMLKNIGYLQVPR